MCGGKLKTVVGHSIYFVLPLMCSLMWIDPNNFSIGHCPVVMLVVGSLVYGVG